VGLKDVLAKMKLIEADEPTSLPAPPSKGAPPPRSAAPPARREDSADLKAILASVPKPKTIQPQAALGAAPATLNSAGLEADFDVVYQLAGVTTPAHGFSALKVLEMLDSEHLAGLEPKAKAGALLGFLQAHPNGPVSIRDVIEDAIRRDAALDAFEAALQDRLKNRANEIEKSMAALQAEIDALQRRNREAMDKGIAELEELKSSLNRWQMRKRQEEGRLFEAVAPFVEANPVTLGDVEPAPPTGGSR